MSARIALLLHMHQPDYRHPADGAPAMPWVRLHALRGYLDVATLALERGAQLTVNVVPCLLDQLLYYQQGGTDRWEALSARPAEALLPEERRFVCARFAHGHPAMRRRSPRYQEIEARLRAGEALDDAAVRDLQVWSNLAWIGAVGGREELVRALRQKDRGFTQEELLALLALQRALLARVLPAWARLPSLSCSPSFHPILPLLVDQQHARRCDPSLPAADAPGGVDFRYPDDALRQLEEGRARVEQVLGRRPEGLWPSEGALSPEAAALVAQAGFRWAMSDQSLLEQSDRDAPADLRRPWQTPEGLRLLFRDRDLSDRIGFRYQYMGAREAVDDLLGAAGGHGFVPVALDGENPWEAFPDAGEAFLERLFASGRLATVDAAVEGPTGRVLRLHTGSWIHGDLRIWSGSPEDRAAWALVGHARRSFEALGRPEAAWPHLAAAEGSDWFWWFGPEFSTENHHLFDGLFRAHLRAAWAAMGLVPPASLDRPVGSGEAPRRGPVSPPILPVEPDPGSWEGATPVELPRQGAMARAGELLLAAWVGADEASLYLRLLLPPAREEAPPGSLLRVEVQEVGAFELHWAGVRGGPVELPLGPGAAATVAVSAREVLARLDRPRHAAAVHLRVERRLGGGVVAAMPPSGWLVAELPQAGTPAGA
jgi:alpha-amylase/alpha-mannosidase (GH57 family)